MILAVILIPVSSEIAFLETWLNTLLLEPIPDFNLLFILLTNVLLFGLVQNFIIFFGVGIINAVVIFRVINSESVLQFLVGQKELSVFPVRRIITASLIIAVMLTLASIIPFIPLFLQVLFFFIPALIIIDNFTFGKAIQQSVGMRRGHWIRILGAIILSYIFILFAGQLGTTIFLDIQVVFAFYGIPIFAVVETFLLLILTQIPIAMVAPLFPLFSLVFYSGARGTLRETQLKHYLGQIQRKQQLKLKRTPRSELMPQDQQLCPECRTPIVLGQSFCTQCGIKIYGDKTSTSS